MYRNWNQEIHVEPDGKWTAWDNEDKTNDTLKVKMKHDGQKWSILDFEDSTSKQHSPFTHHTDIRNTFPWLPLF